MLPSTTTFLVGADDSHAVVAVLAALGFELGAPRRGSFVLLDTFDGRLHRAGLRLTLHETEPRELVLAGDAVVPAVLRSAATPRFAGDLPRGPFRSRLAAMIDVRALLPRLRISATTIDAVRRDRDGRTVASAVLYDDIAVDNIDGAPLGAIPSATVEVHETVGSHKPGRRAVETLAELGLSRADGDTLQTAARAAGIDLAGFEASPTVPLDPEMPAVEGIRDVLANLAATIEANWEGTIDHVDAEFLHDLRVAVRRTRAVLSQTKAALPPEVVARARDGFAWIGDLTGPARDLDVYLIEWDDYVRPLGADVSAALGPVRSVLEQRQAAAHRALDDALRSPAAAEIMSTWQRELGRLATVVPRGAHADRPLGDVVRRRISRAQDKLVEGGRLIRPDTPAERVHDLRKDAKKVRYLLECFGSLFPDAPRKHFVQRLKAFQDNLGAHQDAEVHVALIREIADELHGAGTAAETLIAIGQLTERLEQIRTAARAEFAERFAAYDTKATRRALDETLEGLRR